MVFKNEKESDYFKHDNVKVSIVLYFYCRALKPKNRKNAEPVTRVGTFEVYVPTHVLLRIFIVQVLASKLHFLANSNAGLAILPLFLPVNCIEIGGHVALLSCPTVHSLYCAYNSYYLIRLKST